jgi:regulator of protease activity HflC (stomatin/prohibitin superfamily)
VFYRITQPEKTVYRIRDVDDAIAENGIEAAQYQVALKQVEALTAVGNSEGDQTVILPANALDAFADAFKMLKGRG